jgi:hypothetical protein
MTTSILETILIAVVSAGVGALGVLALWRSRLTVLERNVPVNLSERFALMEHRMDSFEKAATRLQEGQDRIARQFQGVQARQRAELQMLAALARKVGVDRRHVDDAVGRFITEDLQPDNGESGS